MTTRQIRESSDGGIIVVATKPITGQLVLRISERGADTAEVRLTPTEVADLVAALHCALVELAAAPSDSSPTDALAPIVVVDDENAVAVAAVLNSARDELLANSTPVTDSVVAP